MANQPDPNKRLMTARIHIGLLMMFDAHCKAVGKNRTEELDRLMRTAIYGRAKPIGYDPITGEEIWK